MKKLALLFGTLVAVFMLSMTALAGQWKQDAKGWWWDNGDGTYPKSTWQWIDSNNDGIAECYYFDANGYCLQNTTSPDGYTVNKDGAWVKDGKVQTQAVKKAAVTAAESKSANTETVSATSTYVLNTNTKKFHIPGCKSVSQMKAKNKSVVQDTRNHIISQGYSPCKNCNP